MLITRTSAFTGVIHLRYINVTEEQLAEYYASNMPIQSMLPQLSADDREFIMTGVTKEEWDAAFANEEGEG